MLAAGIFDHPAVLLLIALIGLVRWLVQKGKEGQQNIPPAPPPAEPIQRGNKSQTEEERIRRFLEALGQPKGAPPPKVVPKVVPRPVPVRPRIFPNLPPLTTAPPPLPPAAIPPPAPALPVEGPLFGPISAIDPTFDVQDVTTPTIPGPAQATRPPRITSRPAMFKTSFGSIDELRSAIVLREIFGPPRSLQVVETARGLYP